MHNLFAHMLNEAHKVTGDMRAGDEVPEILNYSVDATTPLGTITGEANSAWPHLCDWPLDGWDMDALTLAEHLTADPRSTLYVGACSGRFAKWLNFKGIDCQTVDIAEEAIELMTRRGLFPDQEDAFSMSYANDSFDRVVVHGDGLVDSIADPTACLVEAARVATDRLVVTGYEITEDESIPITWGMTWQGDSDSATYYAHGVSIVETILVNLGMTLLLRKRWSDDDAGPEGSIYGVNYLIEARW